MIAVALAVAFALGLVSGIFYEKWKLSHANKELRRAVERQVMERYGERK